MCVYIYTLFGGSILHLTISSEMVRLTTTIIMVIFVKKNQPFAVFSSDCCVCFLQLWLGRCSSNHSSNHCYHRYVRPYIALW